MIGEGWGPELPGHGRPPQGVGGGRGCGDFSRLGLAAGRPVLANASRQRAPVCVQCAGPCVCGAPGPCVCVQARGPAGAAQGVLRGEPPPRDSDCADTRRRARLRPAQAGSARHRPELRNGCRRAPTPAPASDPERRAAAAAAALSPPDGPEAATASRPLPPGAPLTACSASPSESGNRPRVVGPGQPRPGVMILQFMRTCGVHASWRFEILAGLARCALEFGVLSNGEEGWA